LADIFGMQNIRYNEALHDFVRDLERTLPSVGNIVTGGSTSRLLVLLLLYFSASILFVLLRSLNFSVRAISIKQ